MIISLGIRPLLMPLHDSKAQVRTQRGKDQFILEERKSIYTERFSAWRHNFDNGFRFNQGTANVVNT